MDIVPEVTAGLDPWRTCLVVSRAGGDDAAVRDAFVSHRIRPHFASDPSSSFDLMDQWHFDALVVETDVVSTAHRALLLSFNLNKGSPRLLVLDDWASARRAGISPLDDDVALAPAPAEWPRVAMSLRRLLNRGEVVASARQPAELRAQLRVGPLTLDRPGLCAWMHGQCLPLKWMELSVLWSLATNSGIVVSRTAIAHDIGRPKAAVGRALDMCILRLRKHLGRLPNGSAQIETVNGFGYRLVLASDPLPGAATSSASDFFAAYRGPDPQNPDQQVKRQQPA